MSGAKATALAAAAMLLVAVMVYLSPREPEPAVAADPVCWHRTELLGTPEDPSVVFLGYWVSEGRPDVEAVRYASGRYFAYEVPVTAAPPMLYDFPPVYWSEMPDAAR